MSLLRGRRRISAVVAVGALFAFQALAVIGAGTASAVVPGDCTYNPSTDTVTVQMENNEYAELGVLDMTGSGGAEDEIWVTASVSGSSDCGSAEVSNTVLVVVLGSGVTAGNEALEIDNWYDADFAGIAFSIDMGNGDDWFGWQGSDADDVVTVTDDTFVQNGGEGELVGVEFQTYWGGDGDDTLDASGTTDFVNLFLAGQEDDDTLLGSQDDDEIGGGPGDDYIADNDGDDWVVGGPDADLIDQGTEANGSDELYGVCTLCIGGGPDAGDAIYYGDRTAAIVVELGAGFVSGEDANADGDASDTGDEQDSVQDFEEVWSGSGADSLYGEGWDEYFVSDGGDDFADGNGGEDTMSWVSSAGPISLDSATATGTGDGTDTFEDIEVVEGSDNEADVLNFSGEAGVCVNLSETDFGAGCPGAPDPGEVDGATSFEAVVGETWENVVGSPSDDDIWGSQYRNTLDGGEGNDVLFGFDGNDVLMGGLGNDEFAGGNGADTVSFVNAPAGIEADISLGFASGEGDDSFDDFIEIVEGSAFNDTITGGQLGFGSLNFRVTGGAGNDDLTGSDSNDTLKGGAGKDTMRGGNGDDTLAGGSGNDTLYGGKGTDIGKGGKGKDVCKGVEIRKSCGKASNPKRTPAPVAAKLV